MQDEKSDSLSSSAILEMTADVVAVYAGNNSVPAVELTKAINAVHASLTSLNDDGGAPAEPPKPAVSIRRSVRPDYIICLEDGKKLKMLKRHLPRLLTYFRFAITNAKAEAFNSTVQFLKAAARGFRSFESYRIRILFYCGKLDLAPDGISH